MSLFIYVEIINHLFLFINKLVTFYVVMGNYLCLSDLQIPFEHEKALDFCKYVVRCFKIPDKNILCVGDEVDNLHGSIYPKDPDAGHTACGEIKEAKEKLRRWIKEFPYMRIATSNHGMRWIKKASLAELPSQMIRAYQEVLDIPQTWQYADQWLIREENPFILSHGTDLSGKTPYRQACELGTTSRVFGHLHSSAGIAYVNTLDKKIWAMNVGCLIDVESYAFKYERGNRFKPCLGVGVVLNNGSMPVWVPLTS